VHPLPVKAVLPTAPGNDDPIVVGGKLFDRKRHGRVVKTDRHVDTGGFKPAARHSHPDIGLVLMVGENDLDGLAQNCAASITVRPPGSAGEAA
jgi:hypothetical protein